MPSLESRLDKIDQQLVKLEAIEEQADYRRYGDDPIAFITQELGEFLTPEQQEIALSVRDRRQTNVQAAHGVGKSWLAARLVLWWVLCVRGLAITTAPTDRQVEQILWGEIRSILNRHNFGCADRGVKFFRLSEQARAFGFSASDRNSNAFQGLHRDKLLVIEDEACGISPEIDEAAGSCAAGSANRLLRIGNPLLPGTPFEEACARRHIRLPVWDHPNVAWAYRLDPDGIHRLRPEVAAALLDENGELRDQAEWPAWCPRDKIPGAISLYYIEESRLRGEKSSLWQSRIEGYFPVDVGASILPRTWFAVARMRYDEEPEYWDALAAKSKSRFGLDVGDGSDPHALARWQGPVLYSIAEHPTQGDMEDVTRAGGILIRAMRGYSGSSARVDRSGVGSGALGAVLEAGLPGQAFNWGGASPDDNYLNQKIWQWWQLREACQRGEVAIAPLGELEEKLKADLAGTYYEEMSTGKTRCEDKKKTRQRLKRSPNLGDAVVGGFQGPAIDAEAISAGGERRF